MFNILPSQPNYDSMAGLDKNVRELTIYLDPDEVIQATAFGAYETTILGGDSLRNGVLAATNKRLVFFAKKLTGYDMEVFPYSNISSFEMSKGLGSWDIISNSSRRGTKAVSNGSEIKRRRSNSPRW